MNLVGFGLTLHDSSVAAYKDGKFLYRKAERQFNQKHAYAGMDWALSVLKEWDIQKYELAESTWLPGKNPQKIKDGNKLDHHYSHLLSSSKKQEANLVLDSFALGPADNSMSRRLVLPSEFLSKIPPSLRYWRPYTGMIKIGNRQVDRKTDLGVPTILSACIGSDEFKHYTHKFENFIEISNFHTFTKNLFKNGQHPLFNRLSDFIDFPGKIMSLQSYGKPKLDLLDKWSQLGEGKNIKVQQELLSSNPIDHNLIATAHKFCEIITLEQAEQLPGVFSYSGGVAQNVVINRAMLDAGMQPQIDPWAYDGGCSIGALNFLLDKHNIERYADWVQDDEAPEDEPDVWTTIEVAQLIADNKVVGWYQGNGEVGPRALGNRSILFNPANKNAKEKVNKIKQREWWRPFGASVTEEEASQFFDIPKSRHMLFNSKVLYSGIPGVTHVDGTCRHQTVPSSDNPFYYLLEYVKLETGLPMVLNTSLNARGKPICSTIKQALDIFKTTEMDAICIGNKVYKK